MRGAGSRDALLQQGLALERFRPSDSHEGFSTRSGSASSKARSRFARPTKCATNTADRCDSKARQRTSGSRAIAITSIYGRLELLPATAKPCPRPRPTPKVSGQREWVASRDNATRVGGKCGAAGHARALCERIQCAILGLRFDFDLRCAGTFMTNPQTLLGVRPLRLGLSR